MKRILYPGSFDPVTNGHLDVIERALAIFGSLRIVALTTLHKHPLFSLDERVAMLKESLAGKKGIEIDSYEGLLSDYITQHRFSLILRGLRAISDFEYEFQMALMNRKMMPQVDTVFMMPDESYTYLSSRLIKELAAYGGDISIFVPPCVIRLLDERRRRAAAGESGA